MRSQRITMPRTKTLNYNFSDKHIEYLRRTASAHYNVAEGSIRSGKTTDNVLAFSRVIKRSKDRLYLATASTKPTAKLIIGDCDGYGLEHIFRGQCKWGKYKGNECLIICGADTGGIQKVVLFCGGAKADSYKKFRGMTIGAWIATEIDLHHKETIIEALKRLVKSDANAVFWDLNPGNPGAWIYKDYIDAWRDQAAQGKLFGGYNYQHFTVHDNINISASNMRQLLDRYPDHSSVYYRRDILGERCTAAGAIYRYFAEHKDDMMIDADEVPRLNYINIGQDFGGNKSHHTYVATGFDRQFATMYVLVAESHDAKDTSADYVMDNLDRIAKEVIAKYGFVDYIYADCAEQTLINTERERMPYTVVNSVKNEINDRIKATQMLMSQGRLKIVRGRCDALIDGLLNAVWDETKFEDVRLDNGSSNICILDAFEYSFEPYLRQLLA